MATPSSRLPLYTFALLLGVALAIVVGGALLARRSETVRVERDREPLRDFAGSWQTELQRLERLYESHLRRIAEQVDLRQLATVRPAAERIVGVRQISLLAPKASQRPEQHLIIMKPAAGQRWPEPTFDPARPGLPRPTAPLNEAALFGAETAQFGWIEQPGAPLLFWQRRDWEGVSIVFSVDRAEVAQAIDGWFAGWFAAGAAGTFAGVIAGGGPDRALGAGQSLLGASGPSPAFASRPDFLLPLRGRFGTWQLASWDRTAQRTIYRGPALVAAITLGMLTALLGLVVAGQQRRALALAGQRVSFVNRVSHELRSPLTNILLNVDLAAEALSEAPPDALRRLGLVQEEAQRLGRLIDNVLTFSRREQGPHRATAQACVPASVIAAVVEQFAPSFARRALEVRCSGQLNEPCLLDVDAFAQILANLLSNVEKYVPGGVVEIEGTRTGGMLTIRVRDQGPGIPAEAAERIFRPFERLDSRVNEGVSGTGLGLAIAHDLAASMGGSLRLLPAARGATFELCVPATAADRLTSVA